MNEKDNTITNEELLAKIESNGNSNSAKNGENVNVQSRDHFLDELSYALVVIEPEKEKSQKEKKPRKNFYNMKNFFYNKLKKRNVIIGLALALLLIFTLIYAFSFGHGKNIGVAKPTVYSQISKVSAEIINFSVGVGQEVKKDDILATLDKNNQLYALKELEFNLEKMEVSLKDSKFADSTTTTENSNLMVAEGKYNQMVNIANQAAKDYADALVLFSEGVLPESELNNYGKISDKAYEAVNNAKAELNVAKNSATTATLMIDIEKTKNEIEKLENSLSDYDIRATHDGKIAAIEKVEGDIAEPGDHMLKLETATEMFLEVPLSKELKGKVVYDQAVTFEYDNKLYAGKVKHVDDKLIKIRIPTNCKIKPDQKAKVIF